MNVNWLHNYIIWSDYYNFPRPLFTSTAFPHFYFFTIDVNHIHEEQNRAYTYIWIHIVVINNIKWGKLYDENCMCAAHKIEMICFIFMALHHQNYSVYENCLKPNSNTQLMEWKKKRCIVIETFTIFTHWQRKFVT